MKPLFRIALICIALVSVIAVLGVVYVLNLDPNDYKDRIATAFREDTGRELTLAGNLQWSVYPWLGFELNDITVGNPPGFSDEPMLRLQHAAARIKLTPMLSGQYEIDTLVLNGLSVNLQVNPDGRDNWSDLVSGDGTDGEPESPPSSSDARLGNVLLGGVDIRDVSLVLDDRAADVRYALEDFSFTTGELVYGQPIDINLSFNGSASEPRLSAEVSLTGTVNYDLDNGRYDIDPLRLRTVLSGPTVPNGSAPMDLNAALNMDLDAGTLVVPTLNLTALNTRVQGRIDGSGLNGNDPAYRTELSLNGSDLALLLRVFGIEPLATQVAALPNRGFSLQTLIDARADRATVERLEAELIGATLTATLEASGIDGDEPVVNGEITAAGPDLPAVVEVIGQLTGGSDALLTQAGRELRVVPDKAFSLDARIAMDMPRGTLAVPVLDLRLLGATLNGELNAGAIQSDGPTLNGRLTAAGPNLPLMMQIGGWFHDGVESPIYRYGEQLNAVADKDFSVDLAFDADLDRGTIQLPTLRADGLGLVLQGTLDATDMNGRNGRVNGNLTLEGRGLRPTLTAIGQRELGETLQALSVQLAVSGSRSDLAVGPLTARLDLQGGAVGNSPATLALDTRAQVNLERETLSVPALSLQGLGLDVRSQVEAENILSAPTVEGRLEVAQFDLRRLLAQLGQAAPVTADPSALTALALTAEFSSAPDSAALNDLELRLDDTTLRGTARLPDLARPALEFRLNVDDLDLDRYLGGGGDSTASAESASATPIPVELLESLYLNGELSIGRLGIAGLSLAEVTLGANASDGRLQLSPLRTQLYEGSFEGNIVMDVTQELPLATVSANLSQVSMGALLQDMMDATYVTGRGNVQLAVEARGADTVAMKRGLNGSGSIALEDGVLSGVDVAAVLNQLEAMIRSRRPAAVQRGEQTAFESFAATLQIQQGVVGSNDLLIKAPGFSVAGRGTLLDLNTDGIAFDLLTTVDPATATRDTEQYDIGGYSLPIACTGTLAAPRCLPNVEDIIRNAVQQEVQERVTDFLQRALDR